MVSLQNINLTHVIKIFYSIHIIQCYNILFNVYKYVYLYRHKILRLEKIIRYVVLNVNLTKYF